MTVKGLAEQLHTTRATLYRHIDALGISLDDLRADNGQIDPQHLASIVASFDSVEGEQLPEHETPDTVQNCTDSEAGTLDTIQQLQTDLAAAHLEIERLKTQLAEREQSYSTQLDTLNKTVDILHGQAEAWHAEAVKAGERFDRMLQPASNVGAAAADPDREPTPQHHSIMDFLKKFRKSSNNQ